MQQAKQEDRNQDGEVQATRGESNMYNGWRVVQAVRTVMLSGGGSGNESEVDNSRYSDRDIDTERKNNETEGHIVRERICGSEWRISQTEMARWWKMQTSF
jgi:hypothetical protein